VWYHRYAPACVDIPEQDLDLLNSISKTEKVSRAELVRRAITAYLAPRKRKGSGVDEAFGIWADMKEDALEYQECMRREWDR